MVPPYPPTRTVDAYEDIAGVRLPDPYRWLEEETDEVTHWQRQQARLAEDHVKEWPHYDTLRELVHRYSVDRFPNMPRYAGGRWFRADTPVKGRAPRVVVADEPFGAGEVVVDLADLHTVDTYLSWQSPAPDGRTLAIGICTDGSEQNTIRLIDVDSRQHHDHVPEQVLYDSWTGGVAWLPDSSGFYFYALTGPVRELDLAVFRHDLDKEPPTAPEPIPVPAGGPDYTAIQVSRDGRWIVAVHGLATPSPVAVLDTHDPAPEWRPFVTDVSGTVAGHVFGDTYIALTDVDAPRGRIVAIPLDSADANDTSAWVDLVAASDAVLRSITAIGDVLYVTEFVDTYAKVRIVDRTGADLGTVALPGSGALYELPFALMSVLSPPHPDEFLFGFSTLASSWAIYRHRLADNEVELLRPAEVTVPGAIVEDYFATSPDGTAIPYHILRLKSTVYSMPHPTLLYAYGGFNVPWLPMFPGAMASFAAAGGLFVHAHLRGGAEYGKDWWDAGRMANKENCYADLYAVAEDLITRGVTTTDLLGVTGGSNGGLMAGVAITQRPDLWRVGVPRVPFLDVLGALRDPYGEGVVTMEFGDPTDADEVRRLSRFSPYHLVRDGTEYPAVYVDAGATDPRCPPWHARKWAARMQAAQAGDAPVLIRIWDDVGHGWATPALTMVTEYTEWLAFVMLHLGLIPSAG
ncbi:prolyl oligopeptidase family serine peptidase [Actinocrispum wychmicini]|uniref:prolyl oligopeptidase n=1 Tax=Actinocrispum wychmicini TaxID=1213861 RepID=A0A4R2J5M5_9PSEU|nr:prolyl oligopeptidase family serine peptidase [Actinocrispum wychmicini]TCO54183.1 prolyl oligopeptidase [Actinocrispum wychmicini]